MTTFLYTAYDADGLQTEGRCRARTLSEARFDLTQRELAVVAIMPKRGLSDIQVTRPRITTAELMHLSRQLAAFVRAGIPIVQAMSELSSASDSRAVRRVLDAIAEDVRNGNTLSDAFAKHPEDFPAFYIGIIRSAELTGDLPPVLDQLAEYLDRDHEARRKIKGAMIYPAIVAIMAVITTLVLTLFVLPKFETFFASLDAQLPLPTRILLTVSDFLQQSIGVIAAATLVLVVLSMLALRTRWGRRTRDRFVLRLPVMGSTVRCALVERFTRIMASLVRGGIPLPEAMQVATESLDNLALEPPLLQAHSQMLDGAGLAGPIAASRAFPSTAVQMIRVGEDTGTLDRQLEMAAAYYARDLDFKVKRLATLVEPAVILVMGSLVGFVAIALVSAMYGIFRATSLA